MMTEEERRQRLMAEMMRRGMSPGMGGGGPQEFRSAPEGAAMEMDVVPIELMADESQQVYGRGSFQKGGKSGPDNPNADILNTHGYGGDSVGGDASPARGAPPSNIPMEGMTQQEYMELPEALRKKRRWWE